MIYKISGDIEIITESKINEVVITNNSGIGYLIRMCSTIDIERKDIFIWYVQKENEVTLYGFNSSIERLVFSKLLRVNGIGAGSAQKMMNNIEYRNLVKAVLFNEVDVLVSIPGIGKKTAERIILELKDVFSKDIFINIHQDNVNNSKNKEYNSISKKLEEVYEVLSSLGFLQSEVKRIEKKLKESIDQPIEDLVKIAINLINGG